MKVAAVLLHAHNEAWCGSHLLLKGQLCLLWPLGHFLMSDRAEIEAHFLKAAAALLQAHNKAAAAFKKCGFISARSFNTKQPRGHKKQI